MNKKTVGKNPTSEPTSLGIIVGRFQFNQLPSGVIENILKVMRDNTHTAFILCNSNIKCTATNPLDFRARQKMICESLEMHYHRSQKPGLRFLDQSSDWLMSSIDPERIRQLQFLYINDSHSDEIWSKTLRVLVRPTLTNCLDAHDPLIINLYGSQENFVNHYHNTNFNVIPLDSNVYLSPAEIKKQVLSANPTLEYRSGMIASSLQRFPVSYQCVDIAVINRQTNKILLVRKPEEKNFRFIGGFADPNSMSLEDDAVREVREETGVEITNVKYLASTRMDDWRYRNEVDKIKTALFVADYVSGTPKGADDVAEAAWFDLNEFVFSDFPIQDTHQILRNLFKNAALDNKIDCIDPSTWPLNPYQKLGPAGS